MKLLIYSDLHLESDGFQPKRAWLDAADLVIQAGDLNTGLTKPATWLRHLDMPAVYVPGNHEPWNDLPSNAWSSLGAQSTSPYERASPQVRRWTHDLSHFDDRMDAQLQGSQTVLLRENRVHVMERPEGRYRFIGATLWTSVQHLPASVLAPFLDFKRIRWNPSSLFTVEHREALHRAHRAWLERALAEPFDGKTVVVTHHAPSLKSWRHESWGDVAMYCNDLDDLVQYADLWVHGHVHTSLDYQIGRCRVVCNPRGHSDEPQRRWFQKNLVIDL